MAEENMNLFNALIDGGIYDTIRHGLHGRSWAKVGQIEEENGCGFDVTILKRWKEKSTGMAIFCLNCYFNLFKNHSYTCDFMSE